jgi:hypothetical protein
MKKKNESLNQPLPLLEKLEEFLLITGYGLFINANY